LNRKVAGAVFPPSVRILPPEHPEASPPDCNQSKTASNGRWAAGFRPIRETNRPADQGVTPMKNDHEPPTGGGSAGQDQPHVPEKADELLEAARRRGRGLLDRQKDAAVSELHS